MTERSSPDTPAERVELKRRLGVWSAGAILVGNLSFPIFVQAGVIDDNGRSVVEELQQHGAAEGEEH